MLLNGYEAVIMLYKMPIIEEFFRCHHLSHNPKVVSSNPAPATKLSNALQRML